MEANQYDHAISKYRQRFLDEKYKNLKVSRGDAPFLKKLYKKGGIVSMNDLIDSMFFHKSHATRSITKLVADDFIIKEKNPNDGRAYILRITEAGKTEAKKAIAIMDEFNEMVESVIEDEERKMLEDITIRIYHKLRNYYNEEDTIE